MRLLDIIASAFIDTFGITRPVENARRRASWFIIAMLALTLIGVAIAALIVSHVIHP